MKQAEQPVQRPKLLLLCCITQDLKLGSPHSVQLTPASPGPPERLQRSQTDHTDRCQVLYGLQLDIVCTVLPVDTKAQEKDGLSRVHVYEWRMRYCDFAVHKNRCRFLLTWMRVDACSCCLFLCLSALACLVASRICCRSCCCLLPPRATFGVELGKNMLAGTPLAAAK